MPPIESHVKKLILVHDTVRYNLEQARQRQKEYADRSRRHLSFKEGDNVLLSTCHLALKGLVSRKLAPKFVGPYKVISKTGNTAYKLKLP